MNMRAEKGKRREVPAIYRYVRAGGRNDRGRGGKIVRASAHGILKSAKGKVEKIHFVLDPLETELENRVGKAGKCGCEDI